MTPRQRGASLMPPRRGDATGRIMDEEPVEQLARLVWAVAVVVVAVGVGIVAAVAAWWVS